MLMPRLNRLGYLDHSEAAHSFLVEIFSFRSWQQERSASLWLSPSPVGEVVRYSTTLWSIRRGDWGTLISI